MTISEVPHLNDPRVIAMEQGSAWKGYDRRTNTITVDFTDPHTSDSLQATFPAKMVVCEVCEGHGTVVNPSVDAGGVTAEKMADQEFAEQYGSGMFDTTCPHCEGYRVVPDIDHADSDSLLAWKYMKSKELWMREQAVIRAEEMAERRAGA